MKTFKWLKEKVFGKEDIIPKELQDGDYTALLELHDFKNKHLVTEVYTHKFNEEFCKNFNQEFTLQDGVKESLEKYLDNRSNTEDCLKVERVLSRLTRSIDKWYEQHIGKVIMYCPVQHPYYQGYVSQGWTLRIEGNKMIIETEVRILQDCDD